MKTYFLLIILVVFFSCCFKSHAQNIENIYARNKVSEEHIYFTSNYKKDSIPASEKLISIDSYDTNGNIIQTTRFDGLSISINEIEENDTITWKYFYDKKNRFIRKTVKYFLEEKESTVQEVIYKNNLKVMSIYNTSYDSDTLFYYYTSPNQFYSIKSSGNSYIRKDHYETDTLEIIKTYEFESQIEPDNDSSIIYVSKSKPSEYKVITSSIPPSELNDDLKSKFPEFIKEYTKVSNVKTYSNSILIRDYTLLYNSKNQIIASFHLGPQTRKIISIRRITHNKMGLVTYNHYWSLINKFKTTGRYVYKYRDEN